MTQITVNRTTDTIAAEINAIKIQTQNMMLHASAEIGKRLTEAKELVNHGEWGPWLKENVEYSQSTANNLMQIYKEYDLNSQTFANLSYSKAVALLGVDSEEREVFMQENNVDEMSTRELQKAIKEKQQLEKEMVKREAAVSKEKELLEKNIQALEQQLEEARQQSTDHVDAENEINRLTQELAVAVSTAKKLEEDLKKKPIDAEVVEVVPESVQNELNQLRQKLNESKDPAEIKFRIRFEALANEFNSTLEALDQIENGEVRAEYTNKIHRLMDKMRATLEEDSK